MITRYRLPLLVLFLLYLAYQLGPEHSETLNTPDMASLPSPHKSPKTQITKSPSNHKRAPASALPKGIFGPKEIYMAKEKDHTLFGKPFFEATDEEEKKIIQIPEVSSIPSYNVGYGPSSPSKIAVKQTSKTKVTKDVPSAPTISYGVPVQYVPEPQKNPEVANKDEVDHPSSSSPIPVPAPMPVLDCSASLGTGSFNSPQMVDLSCSSTAEIKYCISDSGCCDPATGNVYVSSLPIGIDAGSYCLSFQGINPDTFQSSEISEVQYTFNPDLPHLQVAKVKEQFQTTELSGVMSLASDNFGESFFSMGMINLKEHDPGVMGLNWSCDDIINDYPSLISPSPLILMSETDIMTYDPSTQIDVFLDASKLAYGNNFITTYVKNGEYLTPYYTCSTDKIILQDFAYFHALPTHGDAGTNSLREFSGGFTHIGFFEPSSTVYRGPAGFSSEEIATQELEVGLFSIFF